MAPKRSAAAAPASKCTRVEDDESNESDEAFFARVHAFHAAHAPFADVVAQAVGVENWIVGEWPTAAPKEGWEVKITRMLKQGFCPNGVSCIGEDAASMTPLYHAVMQNNEAICRILLDGGADPDITDACGPPYGMVPLHIVESDSICKLLIDAGAKVDVISAAGGTPLMMAAARGREPITRMLLDAGADPTIYQTQNTFELCHRDAAPHLGETAAKTARRCGHLGLAKLLDAAERNHPKAWVAPPVEQVDFSVDLVTENRARLRRIFAAHPPPVVA